MRCLKLPQVLRFHRLSSLSYAPVWWLGFFLLAMWLFWRGWGPNPDSNRCTAHHDTHRWAISWVSELKWSVQSFRSEMHSQFIVRRRSDISCNFTVTVIKIVLVKNSLCISDRLMTIRGLNSPFMAPTCTAGASCNRTGVALHARGHVMPLLTRLKMARVQNVFPQRIFEHKLLLLSQTGLHHTGWNETAMRQWWGLKHFGATTTFLPGDDSLSKSKHTPHPFPISHVKYQHGSAKQLQPEKCCTFGSFTIFFSDHCDI